MSVGATFPSRLADWVGHESIRTDLERAVRGAAAIVASMLLAVLAPAAFDARFTTLAALGLSLVEVRGPYSIRLGLLGCITAILTGAAGLGGFTGPNLPAALAAASGVALCAGLWRHLSSDSGPTVVTYSILLLLVGLTGAGGRRTAEHDALSVLAGAGLAVLSQIGLWSIRPQHALRQAVAESWAAVAGMLEVMASAAAPGASLPGDALAEAEAALRVALDRGYDTLTAARQARPSPLVTQLESLNMTAGGFGRRLAALCAAHGRSGAGGGTDAGWEGDLARRRPILESLTNTARAVGLALVSRQASHLAMARLRLRRARGLVKAWRGSLLGGGLGAGAAAPAAEILRQIDEVLGEAAGALPRAVDELGLGGAFVTELFDLGARGLRPLASTLNLRPHPDPALVRYSLRLAVLTALGVWFMERSGLPHAYWAPLTVAIVLQPDYGSTLKKAAQRMTGTVTGVAAASLLLWVRLPLGILGVATAAAAAAFLFLVRRRYSLSVFFVTLFVVLLTEGRGKVTLAFTVERLLNTMGGGAIAVVAAFLLWPAWERNRLPTFLAAALRADADYLEIVLDQLARGLAFDAATRRAKQRAEGANAALFASLQRLDADPASHRERLERAAALANSSLRFTRQLNLLTTCLHPGEPIDHPSLPAARAAAAQALRALAGSVGSETEGQTRSPALREALDAVPWPPPGKPCRLQTTTDALSRATTELSGLLAES